MTGHIMVENTQI